MGLAIFVVAVAVLSALGMRLALSRYDRWSALLIISLLVTGIAFVAGVLIVSIRDLISDSDCVGTCIGIFEYNALWALAIGGGVAFALVLAMVVTRALIGPRRVRPTGGGKA